MKTFYYIIKDGVPIISHQKEAIELYANGGEINNILAKNRKEAIFKIQAHE